MTRFESIEASSKKRLYEDLLKLAAINPPVQPPNVSGVGSSLPDTPDAQIPVVPPATPKAPETPVTTNNVEGPMTGADNQATQMPVPTEGVQTPSVDDSVMSEDVLGSPESSANALSKAFGVDPDTLLQEGPEGNQVWNQENLSPHLNNYWQQLGLTQPNVQMSNIAKLMTLLGVLGIGGGIGAKSPLISLLGAGMLGGGLIPRMIPGAQPFVERETQQMAPNTTEQDLQNSIYRLIEHAQQPDW